MSIMDKLISISDAANVLGVSVTTLRRWENEVIPDLGSGMNYHKKGLKLLLDNILAGKITVFSARLYGSRSRKIKSS